MRQKILLLLIIFLIAAGVVGPRLFKVKENLESNQGLQPKTAKVQPSHSAQFLKSEFYSGITNPEMVQPFKHSAVAGIVSHHFYVERLIAKFFARISSGQVKTVIVVGPNHFNQGTARFIASSQDFRTPWGILESDSELGGKLQDFGLVGFEEQPFEIEHSVSSLVGFVKYYFPRAKFLPVIVRRNVVPEDAEKLGKVLSEHAGPETLVLASVDFSHHMDLAATESNDQKSKAALENFEIEKFWDIEADSPASLAVVFSFAKERGADSLEYTNTNSARYSGELNSADITSYFFGYLF